MSVPFALSKLKSRTKGVGIVDIGDIAISSGPPQAGWRNPHAIKRSRPDMAKTVRLPGPVPALMRSFSGCGDPDVLRSYYRWNTISRATCGDRPFDCNASNRLDVA